MGSSQSIVPAQRFSSDVRAGARKAPVMAELLVTMIGALFAGLRPRASLVAENLALRQQLAVLRRTVRRPQLRPVDRAFWIALAHTWSR